jgi:hypothetical protein
MPEMPWRLQSHSEMAATVIARSVATKQSRLLAKNPWIASLRSQ